MDHLSAACATGIACSYVGAVPTCVGVGVGTDALTGVPDALTGLADTLLDVGDPDAAADVGPFWDVADSDADSEATSAVQETTTPEDSTPAPDTIDSMDSMDSVDTIAEVAACAGPADCADADPCTLDTCAAGTCNHTPAQAGASCGPAKTCQSSGVCACADAKKTGPTCAACLNPAANGPNCVVQGNCKLASVWPGLVQAVSKLTIAPANVGCDLDGDGKVNNAIGKGLSAFLNSLNNSLANGIVSGNAAWLLHMPGWTMSDDSFALYVMPGKLQGAAGSCNTVASDGGCTYAVDPTAYDVSAMSATCPPLIAYPNAKVKSGPQFHAGSLDQVVPITLNLQGAALSVVLHQATVSAEVKGNGGAVTMAAGLNCGVILKADLEAAVDAVPEGQTSGLGLDKASLKAMVLSMLQADADANGDGTKDAFSFAYQWEAVPAKISGIGVP